MSWKAEADELALRRSIAGGIEDVNQLVATGGSIRL